jgi:DNA-binding transcriptional ArsR family regulator
MSDTASNGEILNDIRAYLRIGAAAASKAIASTVIDMQEKAQVYQKLGENKSQIKIEAETGVPLSTVNRWINEFVEAGLVSEPNEFSSDYRALFSLRELGINATELGKRKTRQKATVKPKEAAGSESKEEKS